MAERPIWYPPGTQANTAIRQKALILVAGVAGVGKSYLVKQLVRDPDFGPDEVLVLMAEDSTATYGMPQPHIVRCDNLAAAQVVVDDLILAGEKGERLPKVVVVDSLSGICDYQMEAYKREAPFTGKSGARDKLAEYGDIGEEAMTFMRHLRDKTPTDVVVLVTTFEPGGAPPELALPGKVIPKNLTRLTSSAFYMKSEPAPKLNDAELAFARANFSKVAAPHRTFGRDEEGQLDGTLVNRYLITMNTGEVAAKGNDNLFLRERAVLPDVLRKIHAPSTQEVR